jgi:hypothetical protein
MAGLLKTCSELLSHTLRNCLDVMRRCAAYSGRIENLIEARRIAGGVKSMCCLVSLVLVLFLPVTAKGAQRDYDCVDFASQDEAQRYSERRGGSRSNNVDLLDADGDGIACEPYFGSLRPGAIWIASAAYTRTAIQV